MTPLFEVYIMHVVKDEKIWVEKYRPNNINECILPSEVRKKLQKIVDQGYIQSMLFHGGPGVGKTTAARAVCEMLGVDYIIINASDERGLDMLRNRVADFASTVSLTGNGKCVILDEADHLLPATQAAFRNALEAFSKNCSFIWTANYPSRIIDALHSRLGSVEFKAPDAAEFEKMQAQFFMRLCDILTNEGIKYDEKVLYHVVIKLFPDNRKILNELQLYSISGSIDEGILTSIQELQIDELLENIKAKKFKYIRQWAADNAGNDLSSIYDKLYKALLDRLQPSSIGDAIVCLEQYQRYDSVVASRELHAAALCVELMMTLEFK